MIALRSLRVGGLIAARHRSLCVPLHYLWKLVRRALALAALLPLAGSAACAGLRVTIEGTPLKRPRPVRRQSLSAGSTSCCSAARPAPPSSPRTRSPRWPVVGWLAGLNDTVFVARARARRGRAARPTRCATALATGRAGRPVPGGHDRRRPRRAAVPRQPVRLALPAAAAACRSSRSRSITAPLAARDRLGRRRARPAPMPSGCCRARARSRSRCASSSRSTRRGRRPQGARRAGARRRSSTALGRFRSGGPIPYRPRDEDPRIPETFHVKSFGCQMNVYDGERMAELLEARGHGAPADGRRGRSGRAQHLPHPREGGREGLFRHRPAEARGRLAADDRGRRLRRPGRGRGDRPPRARRSTSSSARRPITACPSWSREAGARRDARSTPTCRSRSKFGALPGAPPAGAERLPHRPGRLRQVLHLLRRALYARRRGLAARGARCSTRRGRWSTRGAREITLLGQNVNAWTGEDETGRRRASDGLIRALDRLPGLERIRYTTSHPNDMTEGLIRAHGEVEKLMPFLHLPVQSGSDRVLKAMNRSHTSDSYLRIIERVRAARPDIAISGDFIVGFPGETEAEFEATLRNRRGGELRPGFLVQIFARARARPPRRWTDQVPRRGHGRAAAAAAGAAQRAAARLQPGDASAAAPRCCSSGRASSPAS